jgi:hypothetical protein
MNFTSREKMKRSSLLLNVLWIAFLALISLAVGCSNRTSAPAAPESASLDNPAPIPPPDADPKPVGAPDTASAPGLTPTPTPTLTPTSAPTREIPSPYPSMTPSPTSAPLDDTALVFLIDSSWSMSARCQRLLEARYQVPELFISFLAAYEENYIGQYVSPRVGWVTYPVVRVVNERDHESANYYTYDIKELSEFRTANWYADFEAQVNTRTRGIGHSFALQGLKNHIVQPNWPGISRFVVVLITDGIVQFEAGQFLVDRERSNIEAAIIELKELPEGDVELIVVQLPCDFEDNDPANPELNNDNRLVWNHLEGEGYITVLGRNTRSVSDIVEALMKTSAFQTLLPAGSSWGFSETMSTTRDFLLDDWLISVEVVSPEAIRARENNETIVFRLTGQHHTFTLSPLTALTHGLPGSPVRNFPTGDCDQKQQWTLSVSRPLMGFYVWGSHFGLHPRLLGIGYDDSGDNNSRIFNSDSFILNNEPFLISMTITDGVLTDELFNSFAHTSCYTLELFILDENKQPRFHQSIPLNEFRLGQSHIVSVQLDSPLESGPQTMTANLQVIRRSSIDEGVAIREAFPLEINARFLPFLIDQQPTFNCIDSDCALAVPFNYIGPQYYDGMAPEPNVFVATTKSGTDAFEAKTCAFAADPPQSTLSLSVNGEKVHGLTLYEPIEFVLDQAHNNVQVSFPALWLERDCGFQQVIIQWPLRPLVMCNLPVVWKDSGASVGIEKCQEVENYELSD